MVAAAFDRIVRNAGGPGIVHESPPTITMASFDGAPSPAALSARIRTKYVPAATPLAEKDVAAFPVEKFARSAPPGVEPASMTYARIKSPEVGAVHTKVTDVPFTDALKLPGVLIATP